ncbi:AMP-binding protein [Hanstruepera ponticola]|uniref:AMP-binding protein n=1 Tax=Hanstruepera ponticola TaxID=2042995 RepID=UPI001CA82BB6|nr:AMP-binding protein [Hanstruepera ponticola]
MKKIIKQSSKVVPTYDKIHVRFKFNDISFDRDALKELAYSYIKEGEPFEKEIGDFLSDWLDNKDYIFSKTSGSTGKPKILKIKKQSMVNSGIATGDFFDLEPKNSALLCLPAQAISGKMMLVRAMILGLELDAVKPKKSIDINLAKQYDFIALTPMQLYNSLDRVKNIKTIIVGGAPVNSSLLKAIQTLKADVYETYGMTETVSHIAIKKLNNFDSQINKPLFHVLPNISISTDDRSCLVIKVPYLSDEVVITNDVVKVHEENTFEWLGRYDNVINSGGVKLHPEVIESKLQDFISERFFVTSVPDAILGEKLILVIESIDNQIDETVFNVLNKHEKPREIVNISKFSESNSGKVLRKRSLQSMLNKLP